MEKVNEILLMKHISKTYPGVKALDNVDFSLRRGEIHALVGANGAGKSTLVGILSGAKVRDAGDIFINGDEANINNPIDAIDLGIGYVPQELILCEKLTVAENIYLNRQPRYKDPLPVIDEKMMNRNAEQIMKKLGIDLDVETRVERLPASTQQMVALGMAFSRDAKMLVLDEPTSSLSKKEIKDLFVVMKRLRDKGHGIVYISHRLDEVFEIADRLTVLRDGKSLGTYDLQDVNREMVVNMITGKELSKEVHTKSVRKSFTEKLIVKDLNIPEKFENLSFTLNQGEVLGLFGQVGSGRTDVLRALFGLENIVSGEISLDGEKLVLKSPIDAIKKDIGFLTEDRKNQGLVLCLSIADNFLLGFWESIKKWFVISENQKVAVSQDYIQSLQIKASDYTQETGSLSGGNQQKVVLGKWLIRNSNILLLDEPTKGIDVGAKAEFYRMIRDLADQGVTILLVSSELPEIMALCDRVLVMKDMQIKGEFQISDVQEHMILEKAL